MEAIQTQLFAYRVTILHDCPIFSESTRTFPVAICMMKTATNANWVIKTVFLWCIQKIEADKSY